VEPRRGRRPRARALWEAGRALILSLPTLNWLDFTETGLRPVAPLEDVLAAAAEAGFTYVGLDDVSVDGRALDDVAALLDTHDLRCTDVGVLRLGDDADAAGLAALATAVGAPTCIAAVFGDVETAVRELRAAADVLAAVDVRIALEHAGYSGLPTLARAVEVCEAVDWERCGLLIDSWHVFHAADDPWSAFTALEPSQIALVHLNDGAPHAGDDPVQGSRFRRLPPGRGSLDLGRFLDVLEAIGYDGVVSFEVLSGDLRARAPLAAAQELLNSRNAIRAIR
jgi:sugar phosphate isomerase/epimerase